ncbi:hypothetical protein D0Z07_1489 [Hyphodiscus hymeniophilus]|uniref:Uncharacterized protein n=1 Tax=Hyphodiscus hymeniophilus TaxID=353542 RepID=A0A9P6VQQ9_9HELO|nr:hypothetical protein D0Z07_1489 [Hyphodiscus hymeniophilus]
MLGMPNDLSLWFCHLNEARHLIDNAGLESQNLQGEFSRLLDWVEYHMVMSRFSHRHWYINVESSKETKNLPPIKGLPSCSHEIIRLFYFMFEIIRKPIDLLYHSDEYENSLVCLENKITKIVPLAAEGESDTMSGLSTVWVATIELFKLAALIYLKRASQNFSGSSPQIVAIVERAHIHLDDLETFDSAFPLLIIGCESRIDEQRFRILEHIERTIKSSRLRSLHGLQDVLQQI